MSILQLICLLLFQTEDPLARADELRQQGLLFEAEGYYLSVEPSDENLVERGLDLSSLSNRIGNNPTRLSFYQSYLTKSPSWRGAALLVLSSLSAQSGDWEALGNYGRIFIEEFPADRVGGVDVRYRLLYLMARYTQVTDLELNESEQTWFDAARNLDNDGLFPKEENASWPVFLRYAHLLEQGGEIELPELDPNFAYTKDLLVLRHALNTEDDVSAAQAINRLIALDKEMDRPHMRIHFYPMMKAYFERRELSRQAKVTQDNLEKLLNWAVLPIRLLPDDLVDPSSFVVQEEPSEEAIPVATDPAVEEAAETETVETATPEQPEQEVVELTALDLERQLLRNHRGLELKIRKLPLVSTYDKIYRNYLMGLYFLKASRYRESLDRLQVAERMVLEFPFPVLETKIKLALSDHYMANGKADKADWYALSALTTWNARDNLPVFAAKKDHALRSPTAILLDRTLTKVTESGSIHKLLLYSETGHFVNLTRRAYDRNVMSTNPVLGNQINQIGTELASLVDGLSRNSSPNPNPRRYNSTMELWNQFQPQVIDYYRESTLPSVKDIQSRLNIKDRLISFVEGQHQLGVLIITSEQAFALGLGTKSNFNSLNVDERIGFLSGRLGPVWEHEGPLIFNLSPTFRDAELINRLRGKMADPRRFRIVFSLKSMLASKNAAACRDVLMFTDQPMPEVTPKPESGKTERIDLADLSRRKFENGIEKHGHLVYTGPLQGSVNGLHFGKTNSGLFFHEIVHYNSQLCSLTLVSDAFDWSTLLDELELINPSAGLTINLTNTATRINTMNLSGQQGIRFP